MRKTLLVIILAVVAAGYGRLGAQTYLPADSICIARLLDKASRLPKSTCLPVFFARQFINRLYVAHTLETADGKERLVVNTRQLDCTTLVENVAALTLCAQRGRYNFRDYLAMLCQLRYRQGRLNGYTSRLHYFSDWIDDNTVLGLVKESQPTGEPFSARQTLDINYMSLHPKAYSSLRKTPGLVATIRQQEKALTGRTYRYIPKNKVTNSQTLRQAVADGDIIAITCNKAGLDIAHVGIAVWHDDGLHLLNASQLHKKVVEEPMTLGRYLTKHPSHTGIRIVKIRKSKK